MNESPAMTDVTPPNRATATALTLDITTDRDAARHESAPPAPDEALLAKARAMARELVAAPGTDLSRQDRVRAAVEDMGRSLQSESARCSRMLQQPLRTLAQHGEDGGPVATGLLELREQIEALDPAQFDLSPGWFGRVLSSIPFVGPPIRRYFAQFESAQAAIDAIVASLQRGRDQLKRDNITLTEDQRAQRELSLRLERQIALGESVDGQIQYLLEREVPTDDPRRSFIEHGILFPLRQRIIDLQTQAAVNQQGVLAIGLIVANNQELVRGVDRALDTTLSALQVAVVVAMALANQRLVLKQVTDLGRTTTILIDETGERLRTQGAEIHRQAAAATLDLAALQRAFANVRTAIDDIARFRQQALPQMAQTILEFNAMASEAEQRIGQAEETVRAAPRLTLNLESPP